MDILQGNLKNEKFYKAVIKLLKGKEERMMFSYNPSFGPWDARITLQDGKNTMEMGSAAWRGFTGHLDEEENN